MPYQRSGWTRLLREHGPAFLASESCKTFRRSRLDLLSSACLSLIRRNVFSVEDTCDVWRAIPLVVDRCNEQESYSVRGAAVAYAWLHLLDRYARTWAALEEMTGSACLPLGKYGVWALDIGTGPGPSAFAINDFYDALTDFAHATELEPLQQPVHVQCVEFDQTTNSLRHHLAELACEQGGRVSPGLLSMCSALSDFSTIMPTAERVAAREHLMRAEDRYYDEREDCWTWEPRYTPVEANILAHQIHRYRLFTFSNFLTTVGTVQRFEPNLRDIFGDADPGSAILLLGGRGEPYPEIYSYVDRLARAAKFDLILTSEVSSSQVEMADIVAEATQAIYEYFEEVAPDASVPADVLKIKERYRRPSKRTAVSKVWSYRKYR